MSLILPLFLIHTSLKNIAVAMAMSQFFALSELKISKTILGSFQIRIGISSKTLILSKI